MPTGLKRFLMMVVAPTYMSTVILIPSLLSQEKVKINTRCCFFCHYGKKEERDGHHIVYHIPMAYRLYWKRASSYLVTPKSVWSWRKYKTQTPPASNINLHRRRCWGKILPGLCGWLAKAPKYLDSFCKIKQTLNYSDSRNPRLCYPESSHSNSSEQDSHFIWPASPWSVLHTQQYQSRSVASPHWEKSREKK